MNRKTIWFSLILLIGAGLSIFLMVAHEHLRHENKIAGGINSFMIKPTYKDYNKDGSLHSQLTADLMKHYLAQDTAVFTNPSVLIYTDEHIPWYITSKFGKSQNGTQKILLYNNVILHQPQEANHPETTIHTSEMTVYPNRSFAETNKKVTIIRPATVIHGQGIHADFKKGTVQLLTKSRGIYEPEDTSNSTIH